MARLTKPKLKRDMYAADTVMEDGTTRTGSLKSFSPALLCKSEAISDHLSEFALLWQGDVEQFLDALPVEPIFDLVFTSPPYNIGKAYEHRTDLDQYLAWQKRVIEKIVSRVKPT